MLLSSVLVAIPIFYLLVYLTHCSRKKARQIDGTILVEIIADITTLWESTGFVGCCM